MVMRTNKVRVSLLLERVFSMVNWKLLKLVAAAGVEQVLDR